MTRWGKICLSGLNIISKALDQTREPCTNKEHGQWRIEDVWPPNDATWNELEASCVIGDRGRICYRRRTIHSYHYMCRIPTRNSYADPTLHLDVTAAFDGGRLLN